MRVLQGMVCSPQDSEMGVGPLALLSLLEVGVWRQALGLPGLSLRIHEIGLVCGQILHKSQHVNFANAEAIFH